MPVSKETSERVLFNGLDLASKFGEGLTADLPEDLGVAPFAMQSARAEAAFEHPSLDCELTQGIFDDRRIESETVGYFLLREWTVRAGVAANKFQNRLRDRVDEGCRQAGREWNAERVTIACSIFDRNETTFASDAEFEQTAGAEEAVYRFEECWSHNSAGKFLARKITQSKQEIVDAVCRVGAMSLDEALGCFFDFCDGVGVEEFAKIGFPQKLAKLVLIDGEGLRSALGKGRVAIVDEVSDIAEEK